MQLAARSDAVANALAEGEPCRARTLAQELRRAAIAAVNGGRVDARLQEDLASAVNDLAARVVCVPPSVRPREHEVRGRDRGKDKHRGKDKGKGHGKKGDG